MNYSFEQFCLMSGLEKIARMLEQDAEAVVGPCHRSSPDKPRHRWGTATGTARYHGGRIGIRRPRVRDKRTHKEVPLPTWAWLSKCEDILRWTYMALMGVSTRNARRACRLPGSGVPEDSGAGLTKSSVSRRFMALTQATSRSGWLRTCPVSISSRSRWTDST